MASTRVWLLAAVLACMLLVRSSSGADDDADAPAPAAADDADAPAPAAAEDANAPENQEEEGGSGQRLPPLPTLPTLPKLPLPGLGKVDRDGDGDTDEDDELPSFDTHMTILGH